MVSPGHLDSEGLCLMFDVTKILGSFDITCEFGKYLAKATFLKHKADISKNTKLSKQIFPPKQMCE